MTDINIFRDLICRIEDSCDLMYEHNRLAEIAMSASELILPKLEAVGVSECLLVARKYWKSEATENELLIAKNHAWNCIRNRSVEFSDPEVNAVRLLLCALYGRDEDMSLDQDGPLFTIIYFSISAGVEPKLLKEIILFQFEVELKNVRG